MRFVMRMGPGRRRGPSSGSRSTRTTAPSRSTTCRPAGGRSRRSPPATRAAARPASRSPRATPPKASRCGSRAAASCRAASSSRAPAGRCSTRPCARSSRAAGAGCGMIRMGGEGGEQRGARRDADGRYEIAGLAPGSWTLTAVAPRLERGDGERRDQGGARGRRHPPRARRLGRGHGARRRPAGRRRAGRAAAAGDSGFRTGPGLDGRRRADGAQRRGRTLPLRAAVAGPLLVAASLRDQTSAPAEAVVTGDDAQEVQLVLAAGALVRGVVSGLPETQLSGVSVSAQGGDYFATTRTAAGGTFELTGVPEGSLTLRASAGDFVTGSRVGSADGDDRPGPGRGDGRDRLRAGLPRGRPRDARRPPGRRRDGHGRPRVGGGRAAATGAPTRRARYVLEGLEEGDATPSPRCAPNGAPIRRSVGDHRRHDGRPRGPARAPRGHGRRGGVAAGRSADVGVRIEDEGTGMRFVNMATTDSSGRFSFEDLEPKRLPRLLPEARVPGGDARADRGRGEPTSGSSCGGARGSRSRPATGSSRRRCAGSSCASLDGSGNAAFAGSVSLDSDGRGEVPSLKPASYELRAESSGYAPVQPAARVACPRARSRLLLTPGGSLEIQVGPQTLALPQPTARLLGADGRLYMWNAFTSDGT